MADLAHLDEAAAQALLDSPLFAAWVQAMGLRVSRSTPGEMVLTLPVSKALVHGGGVVCGQALMAAADTAMVLVIAAQLGGFQPMTTVQLQTSFLRPVGGQDLEAQVTARVLRLGKKLVFGEIEIHDAQARLAAHATTTCALL